MEKNKNVIENEINEEELEDVAGGDVGVLSADGSCWFEPEQPVQHKISNINIYVRCKSRCLSYCQCNNTERCVDRWHIIERVTGNIWAPSPIEKYNHKGTRKAIIISDI